MLSKPDDSDFFHDLAEALDIARVGRWQWDSSTGVVRWSPQMFRLHAYEPGEVVPSYEVFMSHVHPDDRAFVRDNIERILQDPHAFEWEHRLQRRDGTTIVIHTRGFVRRTTTGLVFVGTGQDVTDRVRAEQARLVAKAKLKSIFQAMDDVVLVLSREGRYLEIPATNAGLLYRPPQELLGRCVHEVFAKDQADAICSTIREALDSRSTVSTSYGLSINGSPVWFSGHVSPLDEDSVVWVARDVTAQMAAEAAMRESEERLTLALTGANVGLCDWNLEANTVHWSAEWKKLLGVPPNSLGSVRSWWKKYIHPDDRETVHHALIAHLRQASERFESVFRLRHSDGRWIWVLARAKVMRRDSIGRPLRLLATTLDISEQKRLEKQLAHQATHDSLTDLPNRLFFHERVGHALELNRRSRRASAVLFLDIDNFKQVNDTFGHPAGDTLLREVARRVETCVRRTDTCARLGGDEFGILLEELSQVSDATTVATKLLAALRTPFALGCTEAHVGASIGIAISDFSETVDDLLRNADLAMYLSKSGGKGRYTVFEPAMHADVLRRVELEADLRGAVARRELSVRFQPIVRMTDGQVKGFEALARWWHPARGAVSPAEFIPVAEQSGLIVEIGDWILRSALRAFRPLLLLDSKAGEALTLFVNLSAPEVADPLLVERVTAALRESGFPATSLILEITETSAVQTSPEAIERLWTLKGMGIGFAIDDFGTGYASLSYLQRFPITILKVDKSFTAQLRSGNNESPLSRAVLSLGRTLNIPTVAEGVENPEQWQRLRDMGCELGQGYYFSRPISAERLLEHKAGQYSAPAGQQTASLCRLTTSVAMAETTCRPPDDARRGMPYRPAGNMR
jgi:diguanylate cyclase (GGDEF)-like protein/PAS domain S-box-containing protein